MTRLAAYTSAIYLNYKPLQCPSVASSGLCWPPVGSMGMRWVAKDAVSARLLEALSESGASLLRSAGAEAGGTMVQQ